MAINNTGNSTANEGCTCASVILLLDYFRFGLIIQLLKCVSGGSESHICGCSWLFAPKFWEVAGTSKLSLCRLSEMTFGGDGDTQTLPAVIEKLFCTQVIGTEPPC